MLIDCPACARSYHVSRAEIGEAGRTVICPRCEAQWFVDADGTSIAQSAVEDLRVPATSGRPVVRDEDAPPRASAEAMARLARWAPTSAAFACVVLAMAGLGAREKIVCAAPRLAGLYAAIGLPVNVRGLEIEAVLPERAADAPADVTITGSIRNVAQRRVVVPRLAYEVRDASGAPLLAWSEAVPARTLATGRTLPFVSTPHALPPGGRSILVRFEDAAPAPPVRLARALDR